MNLCYPHNTGISTNNNKKSQVSEPLWFPAEADAKTLCRDVYITQGIWASYRKKEISTKDELIIKIKKPKRKWFTIMGFNDHQNRRKKRKKTEVAQSRA